MRLLAACLLAALCAAAPAHAAPRVPAGFFGVNTQELGPGVAAADRDRAYARMAAAGIRLQRVPLGWAPLQLAEGGPFTWTAPALAIDAQVGAAARNGIRTAFVGASSPTWAVSAEDLQLARRSATDGIEDQNFFPAAGKEAAWQDFWRQAVRRYGTRGSFWAENPALPYLPVTSWEVWNEPNYEGFSADGVQPARYGELYELARAAIHEADPAAVALLGGLSGARVSGRNPADRDRLIVGVREFLDGTGLGKDDVVDGAAVHVYERTAQATFGPVEDLRDWLDAHGQAKATIALDEFGAVGPEALAPTATSEAGRADYYDQMADTFSRTDCGIAWIAAHTWRTARRSPSAFEDWYGIVDDFDKPLVDSAGRGPLPAYQRRIGLQAGSRGARQTVPACGRALPNADGDAQPDENDAAPLDPRVTAPKRPAPPKLLETPGLRGTGALGPVDAQPDGAPDQMEVGGVVRAELGAWSGSPAPRRIVLRWESCAGAACTTIPGTVAPKRPPGPSGSACRRRLTDACRRRRAQRSGPRALTLTEAQYGKSVRAVVRATNVYGSRSIGSVTSPPVGALPRLGAIGVVGELRVGQTVTAGVPIEANPAADSIRLAWRPCPEPACPVLQDDERTAFRIPPELAGRRLTVEIAVRNRYGSQTVSWTSPEDVRP